MKSVRESNHGLRKGAAICLMAAVAVTVAAAPAVGAKAKTFRVSLESSGAELTVRSDEAAINKNGRYIAFSSVGRFVSSDQNGVEDCFVRDQWHEANHPRKRFLR